MDPEIVDAGKCRTRVGRKELTEGGNTMPDIQANNCREDYLAYGREETVQRINTG